MVLILETWSRLDIFLGTWSPAIYICLITCALHTINYSNVLKLNLTWRSAYWTIIIYSVVVTGLSMEMIRESSYNICVFVLEYNALIDLFTN